MSRVTAESGRAALAGVAIVAVVVSLAFTGSLEVFRSPWSAPPREVFGVIVSGIVLVVALDMLFGSEKTVHEEFTLSHGVMAAVLIGYFLVAVAYVLAGDTGWVVLMHLAIAGGALLVAAYSSVRGEPVRLGRA